MNLDLSSQITDFVSAQTSWRSVSVSFPDSANIDSNGTDIAEVSKLFDDIERLLLSLNGTAVSGIIWSVQQPLLTSALGTLKTVLPDVPNSITLTIQNLPVIFSSLLEVQNVLTKLFPGGPLTAAQMWSRMLFS